MLKRAALMAQLSIVLVLIVFVLAGCQSDATVEDDYPSKAIDLVVPFSPGGATDVIARNLAPELKERWGKDVSIMNVEGGSGTIGTVEVDNAPSDGYKMMVNVTTSGSLNPVVDATLPYEWDSLTNVCRININPLVFIVKGDSEYGALEDIVADLLKGEKTFSYGTAGPGGPSTFAIAQLCYEAGIDPNALTRVVLGGGATVITDVAGGHVDIAAQNLSEVISMVQAGKLKALAITSPERSTALPDVPTTIEAGYPGVDLVGYNSISGPGGLPEDVITAWEDAVEELCGDADFKKALEKVGATAAFMDHTEFQQWLQDYYDQGVEIADQIGLRD